MRKKLILLLALTFCIAPAYADDYRDIMNDYVNAPYSSMSYVDTQDVPWALNAIEALSSYSIVQGSYDGHFYPDNSITRAEYTKIIISAFGLYDPKAKILLTDSKPGDWHNKYIGAAVKLGISLGIAGNAYGVDEPIKREEMFFMTYKALKAANLSLPQITQPTDFADEEAISPYAMESIHYFSSAKMISGYANGELIPSSATTRAESCIFIYNILCASLEGDKQ